jgi:hypothetical protein
MPHGGQDKLFQVIWPKFDYFLEITHLAVIAFKEGIFGLCLQLKDSNSDYGRLGKKLPDHETNKSHSHHFAARTVAANYGLYLPAHISGLAWPI